MNKRNVLRLSYYFDNLDDRKYNQQSMFHEDNTPSDLIAHTVYLRDNLEYIISEMTHSWFANLSPREIKEIFASRPLGHEIMYDEKDDFQKHMLRTAESFLELDEIQSMKLFSNERDPKTEDVVHVLRHLAETGEVIWKET